MLLIPDNIQNPIHLQNNWHIKSQWSGSLVNVWKTIPRNLNTEKFYLKPFFLLSLLPEHSIKWGKVIKVYVGFNFKGLMDKWYLDTLLVMYDQFRFQYGFTINDQFKKGCASIFNSEKSTKSEYVNKHVWQPKEIFYKKINWAKPLLIPLKCLNKNQENHLKFFWKSKKGNITFDWTEENKYNIFLDQTTSAKISFFYPEQKKINFQLKHGKAAQLNINYWYLIQNKLGEETTITPVLSQKLTLISQIKDEYENSMPFASFWKLIYHPIKINPSSWNQLLQNFSFEIFKNDLYRIKNWQNAQISNKTKTQVQDSIQKQIIDGVILEKNKEKKEQSLMIKGYTKQPQASRNINFYKRTLFHQAKTTNNWDISKEKLALNPFSSTTMLTNWQTFSSNVVLINNFVWNSFVPININFIQKTKFLNNMWNKQLSLENWSITTEKEGGEAILFSKYEFLINILDLREIAFLKDFSWKQYFIFTAKWKKNYEQKDY